MTIPDTGWLEMRNPAC